MNPQVVLTILSGGLKGTAKIFDVPGTYSIGRAHQRDVAFADSSEHQNISRHHCDLQITTIDPPHIIIIDRQSTHGIFHNGKKIGQSTVLVDQDVFTVGDTNIQISLTGMPTYNTPASTPTNPAETANAWKSFGFRPLQQIIKPSLPPTWQFGISREKGISQQATTSLRQDFKMPLQQIGITFIGLFIASWLVNVIYGFAAVFLSGQKHPAINDPRGTTSEKINPNACSGMTAKMSLANVSSRQVDQAFWQKYPDKLNKPIGNDKVLSQKWCKIAGELVGKK
jgi:pSer/pThr/pTyr-binding forkhead associated (FHA) protein